MNDKKNYERKFEIQKNLITRQLKQIETLKQQVENLTLELEEKDALIKSVEGLREELAQNVADVKKHGEEYKKLVDELKRMKSIMNQTLYKGRWRLVRFLIR